VRRRAFARHRLALFGRKEAQKAQKRSGMKDPIFRLCDQVRETAFALHRHLRHGHAEKVYENGLFHRLRKQGLGLVQQHPLSVFDEDGTLLGEFFADLFVERQLVVELKAVRALADEHVAQLLGYLRASRIEHGLLINFGSPKIEVRKYVLSDVTD
jgi:GxxExxY protein